MTSRRLPLLFLLLAVSASAPISPARCEEKLPWYCPEFLVHLKNNLHRIITHHEPTEATETAAAGAKKGRIGRGTLVLTGVATTGIASSYQEEIGAIFNEYVKKPVRKAFGIALSFAVRNVDTEIHGHINELRKAVDAFSPENIAQKPRIEATSELDSYEQTISSHFKKVKDWISRSMEERLKTDTPLISELSNRIQVLQSAYIDARGKLRQSAYESEHVALRKIMENTESELAQIFSLWTMHEWLADPEKPTQAEKLIRLRFEQGKSFYKENMSLEAYGTALSQHLKSVLP